MKICLLTTKYPEKSENNWLTNELANSLSKAGHDVTVIALSWLKTDPKNSIKKENGLKTIRISLPEFFYNKNKLCTALKLIIFPICAIRSIIKEIKSCDLFIANTPCITIFGIPLLFNKYYKAKTFLVIWDFFPAYLKDLNTLKSKVTFKILHKLESWMFSIFDEVGCMTKANDKFLIEKYKFKRPSKIKRLNIWTEIKPKIDVDKDSVRAKYNLPIDKKIAIYGGAFSIVQSLENLLRLAAAARNSPIHFVLIGNGTEKQKLTNMAKSMELQNVTFIDAVSRNDYNTIISACDIGLIFLSDKLSVPSFPSKSLDYFRASLPILAGIDNCTDFKEILENDAQAGFASTANDSSNLLSQLNTLISDAPLRKKLGNNGRLYYEKNFDVKLATNTILGNLN